MRFATLVVICFLLVLLPGCRSSSESEGPSADCQDELSALETSIRDLLDDYPADADFTLLVHSVDGKSFEHSVGDSSAETVYRSASTSKWVTATVILLLVHEGHMSLADRPQDYLDYWPESGWTSEIELTHLLNFTSGLIEDPLCINLPNSNFVDCVETILDRNLDHSQIPGSEFYYGSSHMQVAGLMAIRALGVDSWGEVFEHFQEMTGLLPNAVYDLPSQANPRLAGGMHWSANEYLDFLQALFDEDILSSSLLELMMNDRLGPASIGYSPAEENIGEDWHYGLGCWIECHTEVFDCESRTRVSSAGAYGAYPFIDFEHAYYGILAREGALGSYVEGYRLFESVSSRLEEWAALQCAPHDGRRGR